MAPKTKKCPHCFEEIPFKATRCKSCGATLIASKKRKKRNYLALFFFLASVVLGFFCWYQQGVIEDQRNEITNLEKQMGIVGESFLEQESTADQETPATDYDLSDSAE